MNYNSNKYSSNKYKTVMHTDTSLISDCRSARVWLSGYLSRLTSVKLSSVVLSSVILSSGVVFAFSAADKAMGEDSFQSLLSKAGEYRKSGNYGNALQALNQASSQLQKEYASRLQQFFPKEIDGYVADDFEIKVAEGAMGAMVLARTYRHAGEKSQGDKKVKLLLMSAGGKSKLGDNAAKVGALLEGSLMLTKPGQKAMREVAGRQAFLDPLAKKPRITVFLTGGYVLVGEAKSSQVSESELVSLMNHVEIDKIEASLDAD